MSEQSSRGAAWNAVRLLVLDRDGWTCQSCRKGLAGSDATVDHIVSKETWRREQREGDVNDPSNLIAMCRSCNSSKGDRDHGPRIDYYNPRWFPQHTN